MRETNGNFDSCNSCRRLATSRLHELHESKFPFVSLTEFTRSKLSNLSAHVSGVTDMAQLRRHVARRLTQKETLSESYQIVRIWPSRPRRRGGGGPAAPPLSHCAAMGLQLHGQIKAGSPVLYQQLAVTSTERCRAQTTFVNTVKGGSRGMFSRAPDEITSGDGKWRFGCVQTVQKSRLIPCNAIHLIQISHENRIDYSI